MKNADDATPSRNSLPDDTDLGPEPDWLLDDDLEREPKSGPPAPDQSASETGPPAPDQTAPEPGPVMQESREITSPAPDATTEIPEFAAPLPAARDEEPAPGSVAGKERPWLWGAVPLVLLVITGLIAWLGSSQTLNDVATWDAIRNQQPPLLPARWAMLTWWAVIPLLALFLVYGTIPAGRAITRIKITGPLVSAALAATSLWIFAQHWHWEVVGIVSMVIALASLLATYFLVAMNPLITNLRQRFLAVAPLSATVGYGLMLTVLSWQSYSSQPFGERGSTVLFVLLLAMIAAVFAFFLRDGLFPLILAIWFAGVVHQQWGEDAVISFVAAVAVLITGALAVLGTILATESHRPSLTTSVEGRRNRTSFFRKKQEPVSE